MKITVVGSGNIGSLLGALLTDAGEDVTLIEIRDELVHTIAKEGIIIETSQGDQRKIPVKISNDISSTSAPDLLIIAVKGYSTRNAIESARKVVGADTYVLSLQNGAGNIENIAEVLNDESHVLGGVFYCNVTPLAVNHLLWVTGTGGIKLGPMNGVLSPTVDKVADAFRKAGVDVNVYANVHDVIWNKVFQNSPLSLTSILRLTNDEIMNHPSTRALMYKIANEQIEVCRAKNINLANPEDPIQPLLNTLKTFKESGKKPKSSMLQDIEAGRRTEIDTITGCVVEEGKKHNIPTPVNEALMLLVKTMEEKTFNIT